MVEIVSCPDPSCGRAHGKGRGQPFWVKVDAIFTGFARETRWFCSWRCVAETANLEVSKLPERQENVPLF